MPRRPRPSARKPPKSITSQDNVKPSATSDAESNGSNVLGLDGDNDADAPRIAQWMDEDDFVESEQPQAGPSKLDFLKNNLSSLPMGALRHAQKVLNDPDESSDSDDAASRKGESDTGGYNIASKRNRKQLGGDDGKRSNKHAPVEMSSKKPVTRRRMVVDVQIPGVRDPRFLPMTGPLSAEKFQANYSFLAKNHETELATLRENLKRARKLLSSSPRDLRADREAEVQRLELAVKRAESAVNRDRQRQAERDALMNAKKEEREKRKEGKGNWWMKKSAKKELLVKARYEALAAGGDQRAVKKAIEKKRKKIGQKEKRSRPFPKGGNGFEAPERAHKRRKIE
ncbi:phenylalanyl-trna synthetase [Moniliophthora roreri MCA 2997]|uniref:rRNA biogenesis protein RRP36 n=2 Tax=Moniliophthora roreri TaxID=221103 RepID=V2XYI8_MONRO|nr:phenylalanyl-trna synthetase [Moniliophthora roreri MCA 2997]KAI3622055.1 phenylalanyl-trna synthetase [Moniliophthora roreri]